MHRKAARFLKSAWSIYTNGLAIGAISFGAAYFVLETTKQGENAVIVATDIHLITPRVPVGGVLVYQVDLERRASCPGEVNIAYVSTNPGDPVSVASIRAVASTEIKKYDNQRRSERLPDTLTPGHYRFVHSVYSRCPTFQRVDEVARFEIEVYSP